MNRVVLIGRLTKDADLRFTATEKAVATFTLAVNRRFSQNKEADFIPIVVWGNQAESTAKYTGRGKLVAVSGRIQTRNYDAKDGTKRYITEVVADEVEFLEWANHDSNGQQSDFEELPQDDGDIPF